MHDDDINYADSGDASPWAKFAKSLAFLVVAVAPLTFWRTTIGPGRLNPVQLAGIPLLLSLAALGYSLGFKVLWQSFSRFWLFYVGNVIYLSVLLYHSYYTDNAASPNAFYMGYWGLFICGAIAANSHYLLDARQWLVLLRNASLLGTVLLIGMFAYRNWAMGHNVLQDAGTLSSGSESQWYWSMLLVFTGSQDGVTLGGKSISYMNQVATAIAMNFFIALTHLFGETKRISRMISFLALLLNATVLVLLLCRSMLVATAFGVLLFMFVLYDPLKSMKGSLITGLMTLLMAIAFWAIWTGKAGGISSRFTAPASLNARSAQLRVALDQLSKGDDFLLGLGPVDVEGPYRMHGLPLGSYYETGLIGFSGAMLQLLFTITLAIRPIVRNWLYSVQQRLLHALFVALIAVVTVRSFVEGAGGYYDSTAFVVLGVAFGTYIVRSIGPEVFHKYE